MKRVKEGTPICTVIGKPLHILIQTAECGSFTYIHHCFYHLSQTDIYKPIKLLVHKKELRWYGSWVYDWTLRKGKSGIV